MFLTNDKLTWKPVLGVWTSERREIIFNVFEHKNTIMACYIFNNKYISLGDYSSIEKAKEVCEAFDVP